MAPELQSLLVGREWTSSGPLIKPIADDKHPIVAVKDPTVVHYQDRWYVVATTAAKNGAWGMMQFSFSDWSKSEESKHAYLDQNPELVGYNCAPQLFYFRPQAKWYLIFQSPQPRFSTSENIDDPLSWSAPQSFFEQTPKSVVQGWLDYWIICDETHAYLFFPDDNGRFYRSRTRLEDFPQKFDEPVVVLQENDPRDLFEGSCVYKIKGTKQYLCLVECVGKEGNRYYRAFTAPRLDGKWTPVSGADAEASPFAGLKNVKTEKGEALWTTDISHGELLRDGYDETMTIDPKNLRFLYQGREQSAAQTEYVLLPYRLALLQATGPCSKE